MIFHNKFKLKLHILKKFSRAGRGRRRVSSLSLKKSNSALFHISRRCLLVKNVTKRRKGSLQVLPRPYQLFNQPKFQKYKNFQIFKKFHVFGPKSDFSKSFASLFYAIRAINNELRTIKKLDSSPFQRFEARYRNCSWCKKRNRSKPPKIIKNTKSQT